MLIALQVEPEKRLSKVYVADQFIDKLLGYMFRKEPHFEAILFKNCNSIHTFFMKFTIDVLFLDEHYQVIKCHRALKRGKVIFPIKGACYVLEGKAGLLNQLQEGQILNCILC